MLRVFMTHPLRYDVKSTQNSPVVAAPGIVQSIGFSTHRRRGLWFCLFAPTAACMAKDIHDYPAASTQQS